MATLVAMYNKGAMTADHLVVESLHRIDPENPGPVIEAHLQHHNVASPVVART